MLPLYIFISIMMMLMLLKVLGGKIDPLQHYMDRLNSDAYHKTFEDPEDWLEIPKQPITVDPVIMTQKTPEAPFEPIEKEILPQNTTETQYEGDVKLW